MKRYRWALLVGLLAAGCTKNLNQVPQSTADKGAIFGSEAGLSLYANSFYDGLPGISDIYKSDGLADYSCTSSPNDLMRDSVLSSRNSSGWDWSVLRNVNYFIVNNNNLSVPQATRDNYQGLARFFRAYFYFDKVKRFGDVPWYNQPLDPSDQEALTASRASRSLIIDSVIADLDFASAHITLAKDPTQSQVTKYVVLGFKSRVCLFEGTYQAYRGNRKTGDSLLQLAADAAKQVIDNGGFSLNTANGTDMSYRQLFIATAPNAAEVMLANVSSSALSVFNDANWWYTSATYGSRLSFTRTFINTYLNIDGTPFTNVAGHDTLPFVKETMNRDKRLQQTIRLGGYTRTSNGKTLAAPPVFSYTYTGYQPIKWCLDDMVYDAGSTNTNSICLMRYAEILLNYAEAMEELGKLSDADWANTIGALRKRAGITAGVTAKPAVMDPYMQANYFPDISDPVLMEIRRERGIELALEGFRFYDLVRWKHGELMAKTWNGMYVRALDTPMDLNGDGVLDVYFYQTPPATQTTGITYINVAPKLGDGSVNPQILSNGTYGELHWLDNVKRVWHDYKYLYPIPFTETQLNPNLTPGGNNNGWPN